MSRRQARECAIQFLYSVDFNKNEDMEEQLKDFLDAESTSEDELCTAALNDNDRAFAENILNGTLAQLEKIDDIIGKYSHGWQKERIAKVDLAILRLALYEILFAEDIPESVSANEAIELAKKYSTEESGSFINGIIGKVIKDKTSQGV